MGYKVLAVDDDAFTRSQIKKYLEDNDVSVVEAKNGHEAFDVVWRQQFDLIILDVVLPEMDGYTICNFLRKHQLTKDVPVLFLSSKITAQEKLKGFNAGGDDYLTKPFEPTELLARVKSAIDKFHRMKIIEQTVREADCIHDISMLVQVPQDGEKLYSSLLSLFKNHFGVDMGVLYSNGDDPHFPCVEAMFGPVAEFLPRLKRVVTRLQLSQQPLLTPLPSGHLHFSNIDENNRSKQLMMLGAPIVFKDKTLGYLLFLSDKQNGLTNEHLDHLKHLLPYISMACYSSQTYDDSKRQIKESLSKLTSFYDVTSVMSLSVDMKDVLHIIVKSIKTLLNGDVASLMMLNSDRELEITCAEGLPVTIIENTRVKIGERIAGRVWETKQAALMVDEGDETDAVKSSISIPIIVRNEVKGVLNVSKISKYTFKPADMDCITHFSLLAAQAIEKTELYKDLKSSYQDLQSTLFNTILSLSRAVEAKDGLTQNHIDRVTKYGLILANMIDPDLVHDQNFLYSLMLHDIGKIKVPDNILNKPGPLTKEEYEVVKTHPVEGAKIVEPVLGKCSHSVLYHHERYDGAGYPYGLSGQDIPLSARIISVADVLDVMTSDRPYQKGRSFDDAVTELKRVSGTQLDPVIVDACITAIEKGLIP